MNAQTSARPAPGSQPDPAGRTPAGPAGGATPAGQAGSRPWAARLACGGVAYTRGRPSPGQYISCQPPCCRRQERVLAVWAAGVPEPGAQGVQGALWEAA